MSFVPMQDTPLNNPSKHRIIAVTPAGRAHYLEILKDYILRDNTIEEWLLWDNCRTPKDRAYVEALARGHSKIKLVRAGSIDGSNKAINQFYKTLVDENAFYIKIDDDIVYLPKNFGHLLYTAALSEYDRYLYWSPLVINNAICSWLIKHHSKLKISAELTASAYCTLGWRSPLFAERLHRAFIDAHDRGMLDIFLVPRFDLSLVRFSINCIGFFGKDVCDIGENFCPSNVDDEEWISAALPSLIGRPGRIVGSLLASHFSFFTQEGELLRSGLLEEYCRIANVPILPYRRDTLSYFRRKSRRLLHNRFVNRIAFDDAVKPGSFPQARASIAIEEDAARQASSLPPGSPDGVYAVVVTHNRLSLLRECIQEIQEQTHQVRGIIVVDNGSSDETAEWLAGQQKITVISQPNLGGAGGFNTGIRQARDRGASWIWCLDDDTIPQTDCLAKLLAASNFPSRSNNEAPVVLCSCVRWTDGTPHAMNRPWLRATSLPPHDGGAVPIRACTFCSVLIRGDMVQRHGLPFKDFFIWADDFEYTARILRDRTGLFVPASVATHKTTTNHITINDPGPRHYFSIRNNIWIARFSNGLSKREKLGTLRYLIDVMMIRYLLAQRFSGPALKAVLRGVRDGLFSRPDLSDDFSRSEMGRSAGS
jgi:GT2 family glycosyltransferase